jgi:Fur family ferric uptake transcriptional regulator
MMHATPRIPRNYALLLEVVRMPGRYHHRTATEIYDAARSRNADVGFATVHRGLNRLVELGLIAKVDLPGSDAAFYESVESAHAHVRCRRCGAIRDLETPLPREYAASIERDSGMDLDASGATFVGVCRTCHGER